MFHALIQTYADAMYVATTLRPPVSVRPVRESECVADCEARSLARPSGQLAGWIVDWLRTRLRRGFAATAKSAAAIRPSFVRAPRA
jgi:hypothetical protein